MGIFAKGSQFPATVEADTPQNRYGGQFTKDSVAGEALGETIAEVNATAESANDTAGELIGDIEALESRVDGIESLGVIKTTWRHTADAWHWVQVVNDEGTTDGTIGVYIPAGKWAMVTRDASGLGRIGDAAKLDPPTEFIYYNTNPAVITIPDSWRMSFQAVSAATGWQTDVYLIPFALWEAWGVVNDVNTDVEALEGRVDALENDPGPDLSGYVKTSRVSTLEGRVSTLENNTPEGRKTISTTGWRAFQYNGVVEVNAVGATEGWTLPEGWRPSHMKYAPVVDLGGPSPFARVSVNPNGLVSLTSATGACYGSIVYLL